MSNRIIALAGYAGSGKDAIAALLPGFTRVAFADELKRRAAVALGTDVETIEARKRELRPALVAIGAGARLLDPEHWIRPVEAIIRQPGKWVCADLRYRNELRMIHARGGIVVYIERPGVGPANDEEARTLPEVKAIADAIVVNGDPATAAKQILSLVG
jgi:hypothetical protein